MSWIVDSTEDLADDVLLVNGHRDGEEEVWGAYGWQSALTNVPVTDESGNRTGEVREMTEEEKQAYFTDLLTEQFGA